MDGLLSKGTKLEYKAGSTYKQVAAVKTIPQIGSDPEKVDVTHLGSERKQYIKGLQDTDNFEFAVIYQGSNFNDIHMLVQAGNAVEWRVTYPDGLTIEFKGEPSYKFDSVEVNAALGFNLVVVVNDFKVVPAP